MHDDASRLVRKLWQYCNVLRDDGLSYPDYVEQLTYLLFLKMSDEQPGSTVPEEYAWRSFIDKDAAEMHRHYARALQALGERDGMLGLIFQNAKNKINDPAKLRLLVVDLIGQTDWTGLSADVKGDAYEGLLEKNARDTKSGAGQYFTPRPLIDAIVACTNPKPGEVICDPACGTGGFLLAAHSHIQAQNPKMSASQRHHLAAQAIRGTELVPEVARLAAMNLLLHGIGGTGDDELPIACTDSLKHVPQTQVDVVLTNPPFGVRGSITYARDERPTRATDELTIVRPDFWVETANKQLNFIQHVVSLLKPGGRAGVVVPDNVLFEGGAGSVIRRHLMETCDVHTLLRMPTGLFYAQGVKANVLFFDRLAETKPTSARRKIWVYDLRAGNRFSLKANPLTAAYLEEFVQLFRPGAREEREEPRSGVNDGSSRWRAFDTDEILRTEECSLDIAWSDELPARGGSLTRLDEISFAIAADLQRAMDQITRANIRGRD